MPQLNQITAKGEGTLGFREHETGVCMPPGPDGDFVACMEDVLDVYQRPYDARFPLVCVDETNRQLIGEVRTPLAARPGSPAKRDTEYVRHGTVYLFTACEPLAGKRQVKLTHKRKRTDWAKSFRNCQPVPTPRPPRNEAPAGR